MPRPTNILALTVAVALCGAAALTKTGFSGTVLQNTDGGDGSVSGLSGVAVYWTARGS